MGFGWRVVVGSLIGFFGAACGSVGGVGGGGIFVPMLALIVGFDPKSSIHCHGESPTQTEEAHASPWLGGGALRPGYSGKCEQHIE